MRQIWSIAIVAVVSAGPLEGQGLFATLQQADSTEKVGNHAAAVKLYEQAYGLSGFDPVGLGVAARSAALAGEKEVALRDLGKAIDQGYLEPRLLADSAFRTLRADPRWKALEAKLKRKLATLNQPLRDTLVALADQDQQNRHDFQVLIRTLKNGSPEYAAAVKAFNSSDSAVQAKMKAIVVADGWPTRSKVADDGAHAAWILTQHMPKEFQESVLPKLLAAVKAGEAQPGDGALLQDRVLTRSKKLQIYGSQLSVPPGGGNLVVDPIEDPNCVDVRRKRVGLEPLADYLIRYSIVYKPAAACAPAKPTKP
jgi:hypothetical protein